MNLLKITKQNFYNYAQSIFSGVDSYQISSDFKKTAIAVQDIVSSRKTEQYTLMYPEQHIPNNVMIRFWDEVFKLMKEGVLFNVETSDMWAVSRIPNSTYTKDDIGWNKIEIEKTNGTSYLLLENRYCRDVESLIYMYPF